jgi:Autotransporter beta-domain
MTERKIDRLAPATARKLKAIGMGQASSTRRFGPRLHLLLATSSLAALMVAGGASAAFAASCQSQNGGTSAAVTNSAAITCIDIFDNATVTGNVTNTGTGVITATGAATPTKTGITINSSTIGGAVINNGSITANSNGIFVTNNAIVSGGISNSGTISPGNNGIYVSDVSTFAGGIGNSGTISGPDVGVAFVDSSTFSGGFSNSGTISSPRYGVIFSVINQFGSSNGGGITNSGTISAADFDGVLVVEVSTFAGGIGNSGTILAGENGIEVEFGSTFSGGVTNGGTISAGGTGIFVKSVTTFSGGITNGAAITAGAAGINLFSFSSFSGGISNNAGGTISADSGIVVNAITTFTGGISNAGTVSVATLGIDVQSVSTFFGGISNSGKISSATASGIAVGDVTSFSDGINNSGTISAVLNGIFVGADTTFAGGITNSGAILVPGSGNGINVNNDTHVTGGISNSGLISVDGAGIFVNFVATLAGGISNSGTISAKTGIEIVNGVTFAAGSAIVNSGTIIGSTAAIDVSTATSPVTIDQNGGLISGLIRLSSNADVLNIAGGTINGDIAGAGTRDTINFNLGSGTFTYGAAFGFATINQVNVNSGMVILDGESNANTTTVNGGDLQIGDAANPGALLVSTVNVDGGILSGHGTIEGAVTINAGGTLSPGGSIGTLTIANGPLTFAANSTYGIQLNDTAASNTVVNGAPGTAIINGGAVVAMPQYTLGAHGGMTFTILTATGGRTGTFSAVTSNDPSFTGSFSLSYDADDVFLNVGKGFQILPLTPGLTINQRDVITGINNAILTGVTIPANFQTLNGLTGPAYLTALNQADGEVATGAQVGAFQLDDQFLNLMLNPFVNGRGYAPGNAGSGSPLGFAPDRQADLPDDVTLAYTSILGKAPPKQSFDQRWSVWGAGFGGSNTSNGDPTVVGSTNITASTYGYAAGMDYHVSPNTIVGFALAGGGTNWGLANALGTGRSDALQAGAYGVTWYGPAYLAGSLAFGNYWFNTNRIALGDQLTASFDGQSYSARFEGGYRYAVLPTLGMTPYAAVELQDFHTPSYSETDVTGGGFGLAYNSLSATDVRTELGARFDAPTVAYGKPLVLYGRLAWAHDFVSDPSLNATFETLPGSGFTVFGAPIPHDSALTTAGAQLFLTSNWSLIGTFNGQFASGSQTYAGSGTLRYTW